MILAVENTPTYKRTRQMLEEIRKQANGDTVEKETDNGNNTVQGVFSFA